MPPPAPAKPSPSTISVPPQRFYGPTDLEPWAKIVKNRLGSGIPIGTLSAIFGPPKAGKSTLALQLAVEHALSNGGHVTVHDTEVNQHVFADLSARLADRFEEKVTPIMVTAGVKRTKAKDSDDIKFEAEFVLRSQPPKDGVNVFVIQCPEMGLITHLYGHGMEILVSDGGKVTADLMKGGWNTEPRETPLGKFFETHKIKSFVLDSVTNPLDKIPAHTKNFPGRSDITQAWMIQIINLAWAFEIPAFVIAHESRNEASVGSQMLDLEGGKGIDYNVKHVLYLLKRNSKGLLPHEAEKPAPLADTGRSLYGARIPGREDWCGPTALDLTDKGFIAYKT